MYQRVEISQVQNGVRRKSRNLCKYLEQIDLTTVSQSNIIYRKQLQCDYCMYVKMVPIVKNDTWKGYLFLSKISKMLYNVINLLVNLFVFLFFLCTDNMSVR